MTFLTNMRIVRKLSTLKLVLERKTGKEILESLMSEFLEQAVVKNVALSDAKKTILQ